MYLLPKGKEVDFIILMHLFPLLPVFHTSLKGQGFFLLYAYSVGFSVCGCIPKKPQNTNKDFVKILNWWNTLILVSFYLLRNNPLQHNHCSAHTVDISNVLSLIVDCRGYLGLVVVLMLIHYVLDVGLFPWGVKSYVLLSLKYFLHSYLRSLDRYFHCFAHIVLFSCSSFHRQFSCCLLGVDCVFLKPVRALAAVLPCSLGHPSII